MLQEPGRIEVALGVPEAPHEAPVQTRPGRAVAGRRIHKVADDLTGPNPVPDLHDGIDGLIGGPQRVAARSRVINRDDRAPEEHPGVADGPLPRRQHLLPRTAEQIDTTMTGLPPLHRRPEAMHDDRTTRAGRRGERPGPPADGIVRRCGRRWGLARPRLVHALGDGGSGSGGGEKPRAGVRQRRQRNGQRGGDGGERQGSAKAHAARMVRGRGDVTDSWCFWVICRIVRELGWAAACSQLRARLLATAAARPLRPPARPPARPPTYLAPPARPDRPARTTTRLSGAARRPPPMASPAARPPPYLAPPALA